MSCTRHTPYYIIALPIVVIPKLVGLDQLHCPTYPPTIYDYQQGWFIFTQTVYDHGDGLLNFGFRVACDALAVEATNAWFDESK